MINTDTALADARALSDPSLRCGSIVGLMASVMIDVASRGWCTEQDIADAGFTAAEILEFGPDARALAAARASRTIERPSVDGPVETYNALKDLLGAANRHGVPLDREGRRICERGALALENLRHTFDIAA